MRQDEVEEEPGKFRAYDYLAIDAHYAPLLNKFPDLEKLNKVCELYSIDNPRVSCDEESHINQFYGNIENYMFADVYCTLMLIGAVDFNVNAFSFETAKFNVMSMASIA